MNETNTVPFGHDLLPGSFRARVLAGDALVGSFVKTPGASGIEILGGAGLDFVVIDEEHAPFDRAAVDLAMLAAQAAGVTALVRVSGLASALSALDLGATGVLVPHVSSVELAQQVAAACRYRGQGAGHAHLQRGFTNATRAGGYGRHGLPAHLQHSDGRTLVVAMIEDPQALDEIDAIAAVPGLDAFFIGRGDLTVALGAHEPGDPRVRGAVERICTAVRAAGKPLCAMVAKVDEIPALRALGITAFIVNSDQGLLRQSALQVASGFAALAGQAPSVVPPPSSR